MDVKSSFGVIWEEVNGIKVTYISLDIGILINTLFQQEEKDRLLSNATSYLKGRIITYYCLDRIVWRPGLGELM